MKKIKPFWESLLCNIIFPQNDFTVMFLDVYDNIMFIKYYDNSIELFYILI